MKAMDDKIISYLLQFLSDQFGEKYNYEGFDDDQIEIYAFNKSDNKDKTCLIRFGANDDNEQIYISNLFIPMDLRYNGIGKKMILIIYLLSRDYGYDTVLVNVTEKFQEQLLKRGALTTKEHHDWLMIGPDTNLL